MLNTGIILQPPKPQDWRFGSVSGFDYQVLQQDGQWLDYIPFAELQVSEKWYFDSMACVSFSANNCLEFIYKRRYNEDFNFSDRFLAKMSGTTTSGNTLNNVADSLRKNGLLLETQYPFIEEDQDGDGDYDWSDFYKEVPEDLKEIAKIYSKEFDVNYEFININRIENRLYCLRLSPLQVIIPFASMNNKNSEGIITTESKFYGHAVVLVGYVKDKYWFIYDTYKPFLKKIAWDYPIYEWAMRYDIKYIKEYKNMEKPKIENNTLIQLVEAEGGFGFYLDGYIIVDDLAKILATDRMRNKAQNTKALTKKQWDLFEKKNLKGEIL